MPGFNLTPISALDQIKSNLQDRYDSGFPILKELLQNADDSGAETVCFDFQQGWANAINPLLRGPGLLVINDGEFSDQDQRGITSLGASGKTTDTAAIGKFGFGQKSVFHLCDAFVIRPEGTQAKVSSVVNPFLDVDVVGNVCGTWEPLTETDLACLSRAADAAKFGNRRLILWLPFRRLDLSPAKDAGFSSELPDGAMLLDQFKQLDALRVILAGLRRLRKLELRNAGQIELGLSVAKDSDRLMGPKAWTQGVREFGGSLNLLPPSVDGTARFLGRESMAGTKILDDLRASTEWPKTISVLNPTPQPEKGEPHGAATLVHSKDDQAPMLRIKWAVFLPTSDKSDVKINLPEGQGSFTLLLHGYFFLDSGRRQIEALDEVGPPVGAQPIRQRWNMELRDQVTLPLIPRLLFDALATKVLDADQLAMLVEALRAHYWFKVHQSAVCKTDQLIRVLDASGKIIWQALPSGAKVLPLPKSLLDAPQRLNELFPKIHDWAKANSIVLCVDHSATLVAAPMEWTADELSDVIGGLSSKVFVSRTATELFSDFLKVAAPSIATRAVIGPLIVSSLRKAFLGQAPLAGAELIRSVLAHVPPDLIFALPPSVEHRVILRALAEANTDELVVKSEHVEVDRDKPRLGDQTVLSMLSAIEPLVEGAHTDEAAPAALAILASARNSVQQLAEREELGRLKILKARNVKNQEAVSISLQDLLDRSRRGLLFGRSPNSAELLPELVRAVPDAAPLVVEHKTLAVIQDMKSTGLRLLFPSRDTVLPIVRSAVGFGEPQNRGALMKLLLPINNDHVSAFKMLCAGNPDAALATARLFRLEGLPSAVEDLVADLLVKKSASFVVPHTIIHRLNGEETSLLGISVYDAPALERDLLSNIDQLPQLLRSEQVREALLLVIPNDGALTKLPIHTLSDGSIGPIDSNVFHESNWKIPAALAPFVRTLKPALDPKARLKQDSLPQVWSPTAQLRLALSQPNPYDFWSVILDSIHEIGQKFPDDPVLSEAKSVPWLRSGEIHVCPNDVLSLPSEVEKEARRVLPPQDQGASFYSKLELNSEIRNHRGFQTLQDQVLPNLTTSISFLDLMIADVNLVGRIVDYSVDIAKDLQNLAKAKIDLCFIGSPLLGALMSVDNLNEDVRADIFSAFSLATDPLEVRKHLETLASTAQASGTVPLAAKRLYKAGFSSVALWTDADREAVFAGVSVPTQEGEWRIGSQVAGSGAGISPRHLLDADYAKILNSAGLQGQASLAGSTAVPKHILDRFDPSERALADLEYQWGNQHSQYLENWRGRVPGELVIIYLGLIGRHSAVETVADGWAGEVTASVQTIWAELDQALDPTLPSGIGLRDEVNEKRFEIVLVKDDVVTARALSGGLFEAPLTANNDTLVIGNLHQRARLVVSKDGHKISLVTLSLREIGPSDLDHEKAKTALTGLIEVVAEDCLRLIMSNQRSALNTAMEKGKRVDQATLEETRLELLDRLPSILPQLKLPTGSKVHKALSAYLDDESKTNRLQTSEKIRSEEQLRFKQRLWNELGDTQICQELLTAIRAKILDLGYSPRRVLFELFQNADDAYGQLDHVVQNPTFRVEALASADGGFRTVHWGRAINHLGRDVETARDLGHARDLLNMLVMSFSDKRVSEALTGKFGLGFKSVHILSDNVGVASGFISLRIRGGLLPETWAEGLAAVEERRSARAQKATLVDVPFTADTASDGRLAIDEFRSAASWLPAFSRHIRQIEIDDGETLTVTGSITPLLGSSTVHVVDLRGAHSQRALRIDLGANFHFFLGLDQLGPVMLPDTLKRLWNLAPLEEAIGSGWVLNGPFAVDPGRGRLSGTIESREEHFRRLGHELGNQLIGLHDLAASDWTSFAAALQLDGSSEAQDIFWTRVNDLFKTDIDDSIAILLHEGHRGYGRLAAERPVTPTGLPSPFPKLIQAKEIDRYLADALTDPDILAELSSWPQMVPFYNRVVSMETSHLLSRFGLPDGTPLNLSDIIEGTLANDTHVCPAIASRFGCVVSPDTIDGDVLLQERTELFAALRPALFRAADDSWRSAQGLTISDTSVGEDEQRIARFAPSNSVLHVSYTGAALGLFKVARRMSGYGPGPAKLAGWAMEANTDERRHAAMRYVIDGEQARGFATELRARPPAWLPLDRLEENPLLAGWTLGDKNRFTAEMVGFDKMDFYPSPTFDQKAEVPDAGLFFKAVENWWVAEREDLIPRYQRQLYPAGFSLSQLHAADDRQAWFTMFALACFQTIGRTSESQHRSFIEGGMREGWWMELAHSKPPNSAQAWLDRLERWSGPLSSGQQFLPWRRVFVDLYTFARWLDEYIRIMRNLPRVVQRHGPISLHDIMQPSFSPVLADQSIDAAPIDRSLGIGINWLVRELGRCGVYHKDDVPLIAPYSFGSSERVRNRLLSPLGHLTISGADSNAGIGIYEFIKTTADSETVRFSGDYDLPLQLITQREHRESLVGCFEAAGGDAYALDGLEDDDDEELDL